MKFGRIPPLWRIIGFFRSEAICRLSGWILASLRLHRSSTASRVRRSLQVSSHRNFPCNFFRVEWRGNILFVHIFTFLLFKLACTIYQSEFYNFDILSRHQLMMRKLHKQIVHGLLNTQKRINVAHKIIENAPSKGEKHGKGERTETISPSKNSGAVRTQKQLRFWAVLLGNKSVSI